MKICNIFSKDTIDGNAEQNDMLLVVVVVVIIIILVSRNGVISPGSTTETQYASGRPWPPSSLKKTKALYPKPPNPKPQTLNPKP